MFNLLLKKKQYIIWLTVKQLKKLPKNPTQTVLFENASKELILSISESE